jgi:glutathione S-transferase
MILIGQFDSPFVRRVGIALEHYGLSYAHRPWSVWANADELARHNPLRRVPVLVLDDGMNLVESSAILDSLDELADPGRLLLPRSGPLRRDGLRVCALATGIGDKAVSLFYETLLRESPSQTWLDRCRLQVAEALDALEADRARRQTSHWLGETLSHADVAVACVLRFVREAHPQLWDAARWPTLARHGDRCESLPMFQKISQPFTVTLKR